MAKRDFEADLVKQMWLNQMPSALSDEQLVSDVRNILNARDQAFNAWSPFRQGEFGGSVEAHAQGVLRDYFSGNPIGEGTVFRRPRDAADEAWGKWFDFASNVDWAHPPTSVFSDTGPGPEAAVHRVRDYVARLSIGFAGNEQFPGIEPDEAPGIAMLGGLSNLSTMSFVPANPEKATRVIRDRINRGMSGALSGYNKTERLVETMETSFGLLGNEDFNPTGAREPLPYQIEHLGDQPAAQIFKAFAGLTPEQDASARAMLEKHLSITPGETLTVNDAYQLYGLMGRTDTVFRSLPTDMQDALHYGLKSRPDGLENILRSVGVDLQGRASGVSAEDRARAASDYSVMYDENGNPVGTKVLPFVPSSDPLASQSFDEFNRMGTDIERNSEPIFNTTEDFSMARRPGQDELSAARREAANSPGVGVYHGPDLPVRASSYVKWADHPIYGAQSLPPTERRMLEEGIDPNAETWSTERQSPRPPGTKFRSESGRLPSFLGRPGGQGGGQPPDGPPDAPPVAPEPEDPIEAYNAAFRARMSAHQEYLSGVQARSNPASLWFRKGKLYDPEYGPMIGPDTPEQYERNQRLLAYARSGVADTPPSRPTGTPSGRRASYIRTVSPYYAVEEAGRELNLEEGGWNSMSIEPTFGPPTDEESEFPAQENFISERYRPQAAIVQRMGPAFGNARARSARMGSARVQAAQQVQGRFMPYPEKLSREYQEYLGAGDTPEQFVEDYGLQGPMASLARQGGMTPGNIALIKRREYQGIVGDAAAMVAESTPGGNNLEAQRGHSLALEAVARASQNITGGETSHTMMQNLMVQARKVIYDTLNEEIKQSGNNIDVMESSNRIKGVAENVLNKVVDVANETVFGGQEVSPGSLNKATKQALTMSAGGQMSAIQQLYQQDEVFRNQVEAGGGLADIMRRGGVFDREDESQVQIRGSHRPYDDTGGGGGYGGYRSAYGPIRAWYASRALGGALNLAIGQSTASMGDAEEYERALSVVSGGGPGPIQSLMTRQANNQVWAGIAAQQQFGWMMDIPQGVLGNVGGQRLYQAGRFATGIGAAGYMANSLIAMSGEQPIEGLGTLGLAAGGGYLALTALGELTGRQGVGDVVNYASYRGRQFAGVLAGAEGKLLGMSNEDILNNPVMQWAMGSSYTPPAGLLSDLERRYEDVSKYDLNATDTARAAARLSSMFGSERLDHYISGMRPTDDLAMAFSRQATAAGLDSESFIASAAQYGMQTTGGRGGALLTGMWEYASMTPQERFETDQWGGLTQQARGALIGAGVSTGTAWSAIKEAYPNITQADMSRVNAVTGVSALARQYGIDYSVSQATSDLDWMSPEAIAQVGSMADIFGQQLEGRPYASLDFQQLMGTVTQGYNVKQLGAIGQLVESFAGTGQNLAGMSTFLPEYASATAQTQARVRQMTELGGMYGAGTGWMDVGALGNLSNQGYNVFSQFMEQAYQGGGAQEFSSLFSQGIQSFTGLNTNQLGFAWGITNQLQQYGMSWGGALGRGGALAQQMTGLEYQRYQDVFGTAVGVGASPLAASRYAEGVIGATGLEARDLSGILRGDQWALSRAAEAGMNVPARSVDTATGLSVWTDPRSGVEYGQTDVWALRDESHALQYGDQQWSMNQRQSQYNVNQAMQFGGSFINPITSQTQTVQYGQMDISDALFGISVNQQRDAFAYQQQQQQMSMRYQRQNMQANEQQTATRFQWREADWAFNENRSELQFAWQMEDYDEAIRYSSGRQRRTLMRQRDRAVISESMREGQSDEQLHRIEQEKQWAEEAQKRQKDYFEENFHLQDQRLRRDKQYLEERLQWRTRERDLARLSAEIQSRYQQQQLSHQQNMIAAEEAIYQRQRTINDARLLAQASVETWLQGIARWVEALGTSQITPPQSSPLTRGAADITQGAVEVLKEISSTLGGISRKGGGGLVLNLSSPDVKSGLDEATKLYNQTYQAVG